MGFRLVFVFVLVLLVPFVSGGPVDPRQTRQINLYSRNLII